MSPLPRDMPCAQVTLGEKLFPISGDIAFILLRFAAGIRAALAGTPRLVSPVGSSWDAIGAALGLHSQFAPG
jgi:hypothetical protein